MKIVFDNINNVYFDLNEFFGLKFILVGRILSFIFTDSCKN